MYILVEMIEVPQVFFTLLRAFESSGRNDFRFLGAACILCPSNIVKSASELAESSIRLIPDVLPGLTTVYTVRGTRNFSTEYIVVGSRFCTCHYFRENVMKRHTGWACKHIIAVALRIAIEGRDSVPPNPNGITLLSNIFGS